MRTRIQAAKGFTLVELIIVVIIIGILAAIAIAGFQAYTRQASEKQVVSDLKSAQLALRSAEAAGTAIGSLQGKTETNLGNGYKNTQGVTLTVVTAADAGTFCVEAKNAKTDTQHINESGAPEKGACAGGASSGGDTPAGPSLNTVDDYSGRGLVGAFVGSQARGSYVMTVTGLPANSSWKAVFDGYDGSKVGPLGATVDASGKLTLPAIPYSHKTVPHWDPTQPPVNVGMEPGAAWFVTFTSDADSADQVMFRVGIEE